MQNLPDKLYDVDSVVQLEQLAIKQFDIPAYELMKRAGQAVFDVLQEQYAHCNKVVVLCGAGNNAGDGYVVARLARQAGFDVEVVSLIDPGALKNEAALAYQDWLGVNGTVSHDRALIEASDIIIDAMLGTGLSREVSAEWAKWIEAVNESNLPVISVDIPSGLLADTGVVAGTAIQATITVSFIGLKQGMFTAEAKDFCGDIVFDDLSVPAQAYTQVECNTRLIRSIDYALLPGRKASSHKGNFGHVLLIGGNIGMPGAVILAAKAALRTGAGLLTIITAAENLDAVTAAVPEAMVKTYTQEEDGSSNINMLFTKSLTDSVSHIAIGMGLGQDAWALNLLKHSLTLNRPMLIDADALNLIAKHDLTGPDIKSPVPLVITPHPGEAARLLSDKEACTTKDIQHNRYEAVRKLHALFAHSMPVTVILKGSGSLIFDGSTVKVCNLGCPSMAAPGMGDTLSGIVIALMAQNLTQADAAEFGVCLHAHAAELLSAGSTRGLLASDITEILPELLQ